MTKKNEFRKSNFREYNVLYSIDISAESPEDAAEIVYRDIMGKDLDTIHADEDSTFYVAEARNRIHAEANKYYAEIDLYDVEINKTKHDINELIDQFTNYLRTEYYRYLDNNGNFPTHRSENITDVANSFLTFQEFIETFEYCHCGEPVAFGFDSSNPHRHRGMCQRCDDLRCDIDPNNCQ